MTHLPFIAAAYALGVLIPLVFGIGAWQRAAAARRKLAAIDPRQAREGRP
ncbi:MAG TPA: hypothetical protein VJY39_10375 [Acidisphaera sp.]|nr:hypothetical protein [Acidisphaera sp.]